MSVVFKKLLRVGWQIARQSVWKQATPQPRPPKLQGLDLRNNPSPTWTNQFRSVVVPKKSPCIQIHSIWESLSLRLRKDAVQRLFSPMKYGSRQQGYAKSYVPYLAYGFVGLALADNGHNRSDNSLHDSTAILKDLCDSFNCKERKNRQRRKESVDDHQYADNLTGYQFDKLIGRGCFGAIYAAKTVESQTESDPERSSDGDDTSMIGTRSEGDMESDTWDFISQEEMDVDDSDSLSSISSDWSLVGSSSESSNSASQQFSHPISGEEHLCSENGEGTKTSSGKEDVEASGEQQEAGKLANGGHFNLAVKFIFNDKVRSDASAIESEFESERIVLGEKIKLREHPNVVKAHSSFVEDNVLGDFSEAQSLFPRALPRDQFSNGRGRNKLLVLVMHRYEMTLKEYLQSNLCSSEWEAQFMVCQLLEGAAFLTSCNIVHKDLKEDNILVEVDSCGMPRLAITDFGCSLAFDDDDGLQVSRPWYDFTTGNNALRAPEIKAVLSRWPLTAQLDYRKSDAWAVGTLAYQICGMENPFYQRGMDSLRYSDRMLPRLPRFVSPDFQLVIWGLLKKDPSERYSAEEAADMIHLLLWKPDYWDKGPVSLWKMSYLQRSLQNWLNQMVTPGTTTDNRPSIVKAELLATFLSRVKREGLLKAANTLTIERWLRWFQAETKRMTKNSPLGCV